MNASKKYWQWILLSLLNLIFVYGTIQAQAIWTPKSNFGGTPRMSVSFFSINNKGYMGLGYNGVRNGDFWEYDPSTDAWTQMATYPINPRNATASFTIGNLGFVVAGGSGVGQNQIVYAFDQTTNTWVLKAPYPLLPTPQDCYGFSIGTNGYVVGGWNGSIISNMYEYDSVNDSWSQKSSFPAGVRSGISGFVIGNTAYLGTGYNGSIVFSDFYKYNNLTDQWTPCANVPGLPRGSASGFSIGNFGYLGGGYNGSNTGAIYYYDFYRYDPSLDNWTSVTNYPGGGPSYSGAFSIGNKGYLGTGGVSGGPYYSNFYEFTDPFLTSIADESQSSGDVFYYLGNNTFAFKCKLKYINCKFQLYDIKGRKVSSDYYINDNTKFRVAENIKTGIYMYAIFKNSTLVLKGKIFVN